MSSSGNDYVRQVALSKLTPGKWREVSPGGSMSGWVEVPGTTYDSFRSVSSFRLGNIMGSVRGMVSGITMPIRNVTNDISRVVGGVDQVVSSVTGGKSRLGLMSNFQKMVGGNIGALDRMVGSIMAPINQISNTMSGMTRGVSNIMTGISNLTGSVLEGQRVGIMDNGLVGIQEGVQRRAIDTDVRRGAMGVEAIGEAVAGGIGSAKIRGPGGSEKVAMSGGEAFKNVPLYVDDLGILMMQLGLI
jgi:hypothetical protein